MKGAVSGRQQEEGEAWVGSTHTEVEQEAGGESELDGSLGGSLLNAQLCGGRWRWCYFVAGQRGCEGFFLGEDEPPPNIV